MSVSRSYDMNVYILQGGGALGAYQIGVVEGLLENGYLPDWIVGTSIGGINAAIIAGNKPEDRVSKLKEFWNTIETPSISLPSFPSEYLRKCQNFWSSYWTLCFGQPGFFTPNIMNDWQFYERTPDKISFYDTLELKNTLEKLIDFDLINQKHVRLSLCAVNVENGELEYFDNTRITIEPLHVMASGALPPGFPAVNINGKYYWDGGVNSNTPLEIVLNEEIPAKVFCFMVNLFPNVEDLPSTMSDVLKRKKDIQYSSRYHQVLHTFCETHRLQHKIHKVFEKYQGDKTPEFKALYELGHPTALNIIRFQYKDKPYDLFSKDFEFSKQTLQEHYQAGSMDVEKALTNNAWFELIADDAGIVLHEF